MLAFGRFTRYTRRPGSDAIARRQTRDFARTIFGGWRAIKHAAKTPDAARSCQCRSHHGVRLRGNRHRRRDKCDVWRTRGLEGAVLSFYRLLRSAAKLCCKVMG